MHMKKLLFLITFHLCILILAQKKDLQFTRLSTEQGLSNSEVTDIAQDNQGFIWIATMDGLNKYDGYKFINYRKIQGDPTSISNSNVTTLFVDNEGNLWSGTHFGINLYNRKFDSFINYLPDKADNKNREALTISCITGDKGHNLYASTLNGKILRFNKISKTFIPVLNLKISIESIYFDRDNNLWVTSDSLYLFYLNKNILTTIHNSRIKFRYKCIYQDKDKYWIGTLGSGLYWYDLKNGTFIKSIISDNNDENIVNKIYCDKKNNLWICDNVGLKLYDQKKDIFYNYVHDDKDNYSLSTLGVKTFLEDSEGNYWSLNFKGGVNVSMVKKQFYNITQNPKDKLSIAKPVIVSLLKDHNGILWAGSFNSGLDLINLLLEKIQHFENDPLDNKSLGPSSVLMTFEDSHKYLDWHIQGWFTEV